MSTSRVASLLTGRSSVVATLFANGLLPSAFALSTRTTGFPLAACRRASCTRAPHGCHLSTKITKESRESEGDCDTITSFYGSSCASNGKGALNTPEGDCDDITGGRRGLQHDDCVAPAGPSWSAA
eukprot:512601-Pyramimonas_sp.AAC.1